MSNNSSGMQSELTKVRGLGSAKSGTQHFWHQRVTALANIPLAFLTLWVVLSSLDGGYQAALGILANPLLGVGVLLLLLSAFYHASLGLANVIEDYVSGEGARMVALLCMRFSLIILGLLSIVSILKIIVQG